LPEVIERRSPWAWCACACVASDDRSCPRIRCESSTAPPLPPSHTPALKSPPVREPGSPLSRRPSVAARVVIASAAAPMVTADRVLRALPARAGRFAPPSPASPHWTMSKILDSCPRPKKQKGFGNPASCAGDDASVPVPERNGGSGALAGAAHGKAARRAHSSPHLL